MNEDFNLFNFIVNWDKNRSYKNRMIIKGNKTYFITRTVQEISALTYQLLCTAIQNAKEVMVDMISEIENSS